MMILSPYGSFTDVTAHSSSIMHSRDEPLTILAGSAIIPGVAKNMSDFFANEDPSAASEVAAKRRMLTIFASLPDSEVGRVAPGRRSRRLNRQFGR